MRKRNKLVYGVGINDADYKASFLQNVYNRVTKTYEAKYMPCPIVSLWRNMLRRTHSEKFKEANKSYKDCTLDPRWIRFPVFKLWYDANFIKGYELDKDILMPGNKLYGPDTCVFVPSYMNSSLVLSSDTASGLPIGVSLVLKASNMKNNLKKPYIAKISLGGKCKCLGLYKEPLEAHFKWQVAKIDYLKSCLDRYKEELVYNAAVVKAFESRIEKLTIDNINSIQTFTV